MVYPDDVVKAPISLKPCPFCGSCGVYLMQEQQGPLTAYSVHCIACGTRGPGLTGEDPEDAQGTACDLWNNRVYDGTRKPAYYAICPNCMTEFRTRADNPTCPDCGYQFDDPEVEIMSEPVHLGPHKGPRGICDHCGQRMIITEQYGIPYPTHTDWTTVYTCRTCGIFYADDGDPDNDDGDEYDDYFQSEPDEITEIWDEIRGRRRRHDNPRFIV